MPDRTATQVSKEPRFERTELVVVRQVSGYSDIALMSEEGGRYYLDASASQPFRYPTLHLVMLGSGAVSAYGLFCDRLVNHQQPGKRPSECCNQQPASGWCGAFRLCRPPELPVLTTWHCPNGVCKVLPIIYAVKASPLRLSVHTAKTRLPNPDLCEERQNDE